MNDAALFNLLLAMFGLPVVVLVVFLVARALVYRHADEYALAARRELAAINRRKELTR
ncbi:hypothetical protein M2302_001039 [Micromonospora sp. A200]|uniref:hypothetical protein n=1 Tax=Micromonospora sp. A200 TaxID=2940568 RepID=UPI00247324DB|nr:hypothetical protein [Micromonospora sp. A200]MDH6460873.1 hypothetical protein [Micromonospora sp. A200]